MTVAIPAKAWTGVPCVGPDCDRILRSKRYPAELAPGTHIATGKGKCARCYIRAKDAPPQTGSAPELLARINASALEWFITARRRRGVPEDGYLGTSLRRVA